MPGRASRKPRSTCCSRARKLRSPRAASTLDGMCTGRAPSADATSSRLIGGSAARLNGPAARLSITRDYRLGTVSGVDQRNAQAPITRQKRPPRNQLHSHVVRQSVTQQPAGRTLQNETGAHPGNRDRRGAESLFVFVENRFRCGLVAAVGRGFDSCRRPRVIHPHAITSGGIGARRGHMNQLTGAAGMSSLGAPQTCQPTP